MHIRSLSQLGIANMRNINNATLFTPRAVVIGILLTIIMGAANAYLGMLVGMTVSASIPAAVVAIAVLKMLGGNQQQQVGETNIVQTIASAGESLAAGVIFTIPALYLMDHWQVFDYGWTTAIAMLGGIIGVLMIIPFRQRLVSDESLPFPEGRAAAQIIRVGHNTAQNAAHGAKALAIGSGLAALYKFAGSGLLLWGGKISVAGKLGSGAWYLGTVLSPAMLGAGYIVGFNIAVVIFFGAALGWYLGIPLYGYVMADSAQYAELMATQNAAKVAGSVWGEQIRYAGVGMMLVGGIYTLVKLAARWFTSRTVAAPAEQANMQDLAPWVRRGLLAVVLLALFVLYSQLLDNRFDSLIVTLIMAFAASVFSVVAGYMAALVGNSHNPVSGMTISTIVLSCLVLIALGVPAETGVVMAILVAGAVCCAAAIGGDTLQDLKAGQLLGTSPRQQQIAQILGVFCAALVMAPILNMLLLAYGIDPNPADPKSSALGAPQANLMKLVAEAIFGKTLPWPMLITGAVLGVVVIMIDEYLGHKNKSFRLPVLAMALGLYLPLMYSVIGLFGGVIALIVTRQSQAPMASNQGVMVSAGLITGEAVMAILLAVPILLTQDKLAVAGIFSDTPSVLAGPQGLIALLVVMVVLYRFAKRR